MARTTVGEERYKEWGRISKNRHISTAPPSVKTEQLAADAEELFGKRYNLKPQKVKREEGGLQPLEQGDFILDRGHGLRPLIIDIKHTKYLGGSVVTWLTKDDPRRSKDAPFARVKADLYVLVRGPTKEELSIAGWTKGKGHRTRYDDLGHGLRNVTRQNHPEFRTDLDKLMSDLGHPQIQDPTPEPGFDPNDYPRSAWEIT